MSRLRNILVRRQSLLIMVMIAMAMGIAIDQYRDARPATVAPSVATSNAKTRVDRSIALADAPDAPSGVPPVEVADAPGMRGNLFAVRTWEPPRPVIDPKTLPPSPPPPPQAPPLPFRFIGKIVDPDAGTSYMLTSGNRVITVKVGDLVETTYRVESADHGLLTFLYQPMNIRQTLNVGSDS